MIGTKRRMIVIPPSEPIKWLGKLPAFSKFLTILRCLPLTQRAVSLTRSWPVKTQSTIPWLFGGPEDLQGHFIIGVGELTDISGAKAPRPRYLSPNTISIQSLSTIGAKSSSHTPREPKMATFSDQMRITTVMNQRPTINSSLRHACQETTSWDESTMLFNDVWISPHG